MKLVSGTILAVVFLCVSSTAEEPFPIIRIIPHPPHFSHEMLPQIPPFDHDEPHLSTFEEMAQGMAQHFLNKDPAIHTTIISKPDGHVQIREITHRAIGNDVRHGLHLFHPFNDHFMHHNKNHHHHGHKGSHLSPYHRLHQHSHQLARVGFLSPEMLNPPIFSLSSTEAEPARFLKLSANADHEDNKHCREDFSRFCEEHLKFDGEKPFDMFFRGYHCLKENEAVLSSGCKEHLPETMFANCESDIEKFCDFQHPIILTLKDKHRELSSECVEYLDKQADAIPIHEHVNEGLKNLIDGVLRTFNEVASGLDAEVQNAPLSSSPLRDQDHEASDSDSTPVRTFSKMTTVDDDGVVTSSKMTLSVSGEDKVDQSEDLIEQIQSTDVSNEIAESLKGEDKNVEKTAMVNIQESRGENHDLFKEYMAGHPYIIFLGVALCLTMVTIGYCIMGRKDESELHDPTGDKARYLAAGPQNNGFLCFTG